MSPPAADASKPEGSDLPGHTRLSLIASVSALLWLSGIATLTHLVG